MTIGGNESSVPFHPRPGDFAQVALAASGGPPRTRARDQQADLAGESLRRQVLDRLIALDPEPDEMESSLQDIVTQLGEPTGPTRGVCLAILQEWDMVRGNPAYWSFLVAEAVRAEDEPAGGQRKRRHRTSDPPINDPDPH